MIYMMIFTEFGQKSASNRVIYDVYDRDICLTCRGSVVRVHYRPNITICMTTGARARALFLLCMYYIFHSARNSFKIVRIPRPIVINPIALLSKLVFIFITVYAERGTDMIAPITR
jgi:hypothetical protein